MSEVRMTGIRLAFPAANGELFQVIDSVDLQVEPGQFVSLLGPSGCGKSTLFNILSGLVRPDQGEIIVGGRVVTAKVGAVAYMPQKDLLLPWRSVIDNAIIGLELAGVSKETARLRAHELIPLFGLEGFENAFPSVLSGGMKQRVALMRTVLLEKGVLALDEPFGALDALTRRQMQEWLAGLQQSLKKTVLFITHDVEEALRLSDVVYLFSHRPARVIARVDTGGLNRRTSDPGFIRMKEQLIDRLEADCR